MKPVAERQRASYGTSAVPVHPPTNHTRNRYVPTQRASTIRLRTSLFQEAAEIVDREYASDLSLDDIARRVASSRRQLQRAYAEIGQTTFRDHLTRVRMQKAAEMLATRALTVREVAHRVGYRQPAQFAKAFRRYQGVAPSDFRANGRAAMRPTGTQFSARPAYRAA
jgi:AraC family transcriptional regulator, regulatory protein of adaptative response / methylphosphotriester-DNA alkyltransferase methyltransferase